MNSLMFVPQYIDRTGGIVFLTFTWVGAIGILASVYTVHTYSKLVAMVPGAATSGAVKLGLSVLSV